MSTLLVFTNLPDRAAAERLADGWNRADGLFGALDARRLPR